MSQLRHLRFAGLPSFILASAYFFGILLRRVDVVVFIVPFVLVADLLLA